MTVFRAMRRHILTFCLLMLSAAAAGAAPLTVFAAASLTDAMNDVSIAWAAQGHDKLRLSFASSSTLAKQIDQGAPANLFASADEKWMDWLAKHNGIAADTRRDLLGNQLVLVVPKTFSGHVTIAPGFAIGHVLGTDGRLAMGDPAHVPAGIYGKQALTKLGLWPAVETRLAPAEDVRAALRFVRSGEAPAGIVYATDALAEPGVKIAGVFPPGSHDPITYPFAVTKSGDTTESRALLAWLSGPEARKIFVKWGFSAP